jgi:hypothetical protein
MERIELPALPREIGTTYVTGLGINFCQGSILWSQFFCEFRQLLPNKWGFFLKNAMMKFLQKLAAV